MSPLQNEVTEELVSFERDHFKLEGSLHYDESGVADRAVLLASPHPHFGGDRNNNVIRALSLGLVCKHALTLSFDYHGVLDESGLPDLASSFDYWSEVEEKQDYSGAESDVRAAVRYLNQISQQKPVVAIGYSFGAAVSGKVAPEVTNLAGLILICPPTAQVDYSFMRGFTGHCLLITAENDFASTNESNLDLFEGLMGWRQHCHLEHSDHFFRGEEDSLVVACRTFLNTCSVSREPIPGL